MDADVSAGQAAGNGGGLEHLNAVLLARGYIKKPLRFDDSATSTQQDASKGQDKLSTIADLLTTILAERDADLELKGKLAARVRALESSLERKGKALTEEIEARLDAQRGETAALAKISSISAQLQREEAAHKTTRDDLARLRRDVASLKQSTAQAKVRAERKAEGLRARIGELSTQALLAKGCAADVRVIGGVFDSGNGAARDEMTDSTAGQLARDQLAELEEERSAHLAEMVALKQLAVESINALREAGRKLAFHVGYERAEMAGTGAASGGKKKAKAVESSLLAASTATAAYIGDLFPPNFSLSASTSSSSASADHPAFTALSDALGEVRGQGEQLEALKADRSAALQRLLSKAKLKISEEAWTEAEASAQRQGGSIAEEAAAAVRELQNALARVAELQASCDRHAQMLAQSEEAHVATRGLLEHYRQRGLHAVAAQSPSGADHKGKGKADATRTLSIATEKREVSDRLRELEQEKQRYIMQRQELEREKAALSAAKAAEPASVPIAEPQAAAADTSVASAASAPSVRSRASASRSMARRSRTQADESVASPAPAVAAPFSAAATVPSPFAPADSSRDASFSNRVARRIKRDSLQRTQAASGSPAAAAGPVAMPVDASVDAAANGTVIDHGAPMESMVADGTVVDHGAEPAQKEEEQPVDIWKAASAKLSRFANLNAPSSAAEAGSSSVAAASSGSKKRKAEDAVPSSDAATAPAAAASASDGPSAAVLALSKRIRTARGGDAAADGAAPRPPLANHNNQDRRRRRSSARIASMGEQPGKPAGADAQPAASAAASKPAGASVPSVAATRKRLQNFSARGAEGARLTSQGRRSKAV